MSTLALKIARFTAFILLVLGLVLPWLRVPVGLSEKSGETFVPRFTEPLTTGLFKVSLLGVILVALWLGWRRKAVVRWAAPMRVTGGILLLGVGLLYPALTIQRCPSVSAHAAWLEAQHDSLIGPFGDAFTAQEYEHQPGEPEIQVKEVFPRSFQVIPTPMISSVTDLNFSKLEEILMWLGLAPAFCQFAYWGWYCSIFGAFLLAISFLRERQPVGLEESRLAFGIVPWFVCAAPLVGLACLLPVVFAGWTLNRAQSAAAEGAFSTSLRYLDAAQRWVPSLAYDTEMLYQKGYLMHRLGLNFPEKTLFDAINLEEAGLDKQADVQYLALLNSPEHAVRDEAFRGALRLATQEFNSGVLDRAESELHRLLDVDPTSLKASYALQLVDLRAHQKDKLESDVSKFETVYDAFQSIEKGAVIAAAHRRLAYLEFDFKDRSRLGDEMRAAVQSE
jgi:hypothetical protein